jgi:hypothetical protein
MLSMARTIVLSHAQRERERERERIDTNQVKSDKERNRRVAEREKERERDVSECMPEHRREYEKHSFIEWCMYYSTCRAREIESTINFFQTTSD